MKTKKLLSTILVSALLTGLMAGCGSSSSTGSNDSAGKSGGKTVKVFQLKVEINDALQQLAKKYEQEKGVKVEITSVGGGADYGASLKAEFQKGTEPDIFMIQGAGDYDVWKHKIDDLSSEAWTKNAVKGTLDTVTFDGKVYGLPYTQATAVFFVNKELFDQNGIKIPETYNELVTAVKAFRAKGITPMTVGAKDEWPTTQYFDIMAIRAAGAKVVNDALNKKGSYEDPGFIDAAAKFQELVKLQAFNDGALGVTRDESEMAFYDGKVPMYVNGSWTVGNIQKEGSKIKDKILALRFPLIEGGKGDINDFTGGAAEGFFVGANTKHKEESVKLLKFITEHHSKEAYLVGAGIPTWKMDVDESKLDPLNLQIAKNLKEAKTTTQWFNSLLLTKDADDYQKELTQLFSLQVTPEQFAKDMQKMNAK